MQQEGADTLWVGTGKGLYRVNLRNGTIDTIKGLEKAHIRSLSIPHTNEVWITTFGSGFFLYSNHCLTRFPLDKAGYLAMAHCFVEDSKGFCWIPTNKGLFRASKNDLLNYAQAKQQQVFYLYYTSEEGFNTNEFNGGCQPCALQLPNGYISLPSLNGLVWFDPAKVNSVLPDKKIFIDRIEVDQVTVPLKDTLTLSRRFKLLKLYCSTPYAGNEYNINVQYAWLKDGEKPVWLSLDNDKIISQSSLVNGTYTLFIRKANGFGKDNYSYRTLVVIVPPAFYETWWFYGALLVVIVFLMLMYARFRLNYIRRKNRQLEALVDERTEELSRTLSALSVSEQNIRRQMHVREILFTAISHDIGSPLKYMSMMAEELRDNLETEKVPEKMKKYADDIFQSGYYLYHLTRNLLQYLRISEENSAFKYKQFDLHKLVDNKTIIFQPIAAQQSVAVINRVPESFYLYNDPLLLEVVIHNLLDNAVKATREGSVTIRVDMIDGQTHLVIEDTGHGMREEVVNYYNNDTTAREDNIKPDGFYAGFGLNIVKELTRLMGVKLHIQASAVGTAVHLIFRELSAGE
jgi:signal transduction histidine kinase